MLPLTDTLLAPPTMAAMLSLTDALLAPPTMAAMLPLTDTLLAPPTTAARRQEEEALLSEMDVTGQAFEDMQEQNLRLLQQLREKDDANFKLMSERIKANQIHKLLREEKDELAEQVLALKAQVEAQLQVVQKLEEKERGLQSALGAVEKELSLRSQALELHKRKVRGLRWAQVGSGVGTGVSRCPQ
ncbi:E3 ubiquitin-protein ligase BRE1B-like, partial [Cyanistes caeruleus]